MSNKSILDERVRKFRTASRELFNNYFSTQDPWKKGSLAWDEVDNFRQVEKSLFQHMVLIPEKIGLMEYGAPHPDIEVSAAIDLKILPAFINRERNSGYWDYHVNQIPAPAKIKFICFFDWSDLDTRDNEFVRVLIDECPSLPELNGRHALVRPLNVKFVKAVS